MADTKHELEIIARMRDVVSPTTATMASNAKRSFDDIGRGAERASASVGGVEKSASRAAPGLRAMGTEGKRAGTDMVDPLARAGKAIDGVSTGARTARESLRGLAAESKRTADAMVADAERAAAAESASGGGLSLGGVGRAVGKGARFGRIAGSVAGSAAMALGASAGGGVGDVVGGAAMGAAIGSAVPVVGTAIGAVAGTVYGLVQAFRHATKAEEDLAAAGRKAADEVRAAADERTRLSSDFIRDTDREIALINAKSDAERTALRNAYELDDVRAKLGDQAAEEVRRRQAVAAEKAIDDARIAGWKADDERWKRQDEQAAKEKADAAKAAAEKKAARDAEIDDMLKRARMTDDELKHAREYKLIAEAEAAGDSRRATLLREMVDAMKAQTAEAERARAASEARAVAERQILDANREQAAEEKAAAEERRRSFQEGASGIRSGTWEVSGPDTMRTASGGSAGTGGVVDLRAQDRAAKSQRARDARTARRNANYLGEKRDRGLYIDGDGDGADAALRRVYSKGRRSRVDPGDFVVEDFDGGVGGLGEEGGNARMRGRFGHGGRARSGSDGWQGPVVTPTDPAPDVKNAADATGRAADSGKRVADAAGKIATSADALKASSDDAASNIEKSATATTDAATAMERVATAETSRTADMQRLVEAVARIEEQQKKQAEMIDTIMKAGG